MSHGGLALAHNRKHGLAEHSASLAREFRNTPRAANADDVVGANPAEVP